MKQFTKDMLEAGMLVDLRCGERGMVMPTANPTCIKLCIMLLENGILVDDFDCNFTHEYHKEYDIVRVYSITKHKDTNSFYMPCFETILDFVESHELLWERVEKVTMADIEKKFNCKIEIVG